MYPKFSQSHLYFLYRKHTSLKRKKDSDEVRKNKLWGSKELWKYTFYFYFLIDVEIELRKR